MTISFNRRRVGGSEATDQNFEQIEEVLAEVQSNPTYTTNIVENIALSTTELAVNHGLETAPIGMVVIMKDANAVIYKGSDSASPSRFINIVASAPVTANILFF